VEDGLLAWWQAVPGGVLAAAACLAVAVYLHPWIALSAALLAAAFGVPVIASRVGGLPEAVEHEETGLLVQNDETEIAAAVRRLVSDPEWAASLGEGGRRRIELQFLPQHTASATVAAYREVLAQ